MHKAATGLIVAALLAGCGANDEILPGAREPIRPPQTELQSKSTALSLASAKVNADWTHRNGSATHRIGHPALGTTLQMAFATDIGAGSSARNRISADPIVAGGRVFAMDALDHVSALSTGGAPLWTKSLSPASDRGREGAGGGLAYGGGKLFATTGFGELVALDPATGERLWTQDIEAPGGAAPTYANGLVYVAARNGVGWAVDAGTGRVRWTLSATPATEGFGFGSGVAATSDMAIFPFMGGEVIGAFPKGGLRRWSSIIAGERPGHAAASISDITGDPVIVGDTVYVGNISGRLVAMNRETGERRWTATMAAKHPVWPAGNALFLVNDLNELVRLEASTGAVVWRIQLPKFAERRWRKSNRFYAHYGPVLAGGRLVVASSDGMLRSFDPRSGALTGQIEMPGGAASAPAVAGGMLYVATNKGQIVGYR